MIPVDQPLFYFSYVFENLVTSWLELFSPRNRSRRVVIRWYSLTIISVGYNWTIRNPRALWPGEENNFRPPSFPFVHCPAFRPRSTSARTNVPTFPRPFSNLYFLFIYERANKRAFKIAKIIINKLNERPASRARMHARDRFETFRVFFLSPRNNYICICTHFLLRLFLSSSLLLFVE